MTQETINEVLEFRDDRNWKQFHNPKDLAISISLEAAELLEVSASTATRLLKRMVESHMLKRNGKARNTYYTEIK